MYKTVIGLEVHCEVITNSKNFSTAKNSYSEYPNEKSNSDGSFAQPSYKSFTPPAGFVPNEADINQPAIWRKPEFSRSIKLSDD